MRRVLRLREWAGQKEIKNLPRAGSWLIPFLLEAIGGKADLDQPDRIHPNPKGHKTVADNVWAVLEPLLNARSDA